MFSVWALELKIVQKLGDMVVTEELAVSICQLCQDFFLIYIVFRAIAFRA